MLVKAVPEHRTALAIFYQHIFVPLADFVPLRINDIELEWQAFYGDCNFVCRRGRRVCELMLPYIISGSSPQTYLSLPILCILGKNLCHPKQFYVLMTQHVHHGFHLPLTIVLRQLNELLRPSPHLKQNRRKYIASWVFLFFVVFLLCFVLFYGFVWLSPEAYWTKGDNISFANSPLNSNGGLTKLRLTSLVIETLVRRSHILRQWTEECHASARFPAAFWCRFCNLSNNSYSSNVYTHT